MPGRRSGSPIGFWDNVAAGANSVSTAVEVMRDADQLAIFVTVSGATTISVECAHSGAVNDDGTLTDDNASDWGQLYYIDTPLQIAFSSAGSISLIIPDFEPGWIRLRTSNAVTITAGHEVTAG